jgi:hypothetical protein
MVNTWPNVWEQQPTLQRALILRYLFDIYIWDVDFGGIDIGVEAELAMIEQTTLEERARSSGGFRSSSTLPRRIASPTGADRLWKPQKDEYCEHGTDHRSDCH